LYNIICAGNGVAAEMNFMEEAVQQYSKKKGQSQRGNGQANLNFELVARQVMQSLKQGIQMNNSDLNSNSVEDVLSSL
jgi:hypothetical protein